MAGQRITPWASVATAGEWLLILLSGAGAALAGTHPTSTPVVDPLFAAALGTAVAWLSGVCGRPAVLWLAGLGLVLSRGWLLLPAAIALGAGFAWSLPRHPQRLAGVAIGATAVQVVLRWPATGFHGLSALAAAAAVSPVLVHGLHAGARPRARTWLVAGFGLLALAAVLVGPLAVQVLRSRAGIDRAAALTETALASVRAGNATQATGTLRRAAADFTAAHGRLDAWWTAGADLVPGVAQQRRALVTAVSVASEVTASVAAHAGSIDVSDLHYRNGTLDLARVESLRAPLSSVGADLRRGSSRLDAVRSGWLLAPVQSRLARLQHQLSTASSTDNLAAQAVAEAPSLLGADGTRHYLIALLDTSESRGLGGLLVWYGNLVAAGGHISLSSYGDALGIDAQLQSMGGGRLTGPPGYLARYGQFHPSDYFIDAPFSPDLPTVTDVVSQLYTDTGHPPVDGLLVLDPRSLAAVFRFTGPVSVPGFGTVDASNAEQLLERGQYALFPGPGDQEARKASLSHLMQDASQRLTAGGGPGLQSLARTLGPDVRTGDLEFWSVHAADQPLLERIGISGRFPSSRGGDLLSVTTQNSGANKIDAYLQRAITDRVTYRRRTGAVSAEVTVDLSNSAPAAGLSYQVIDNLSGQGLPPGTNSTWLTVYTPLRLVAADVDGRPVGFTSGTELGVNAYSTFLQVGPGKTLRLSVDLAGRLVPGRPYSLAMYRQPMVNPDRVRITVEGAGTATAVWVPPDDVDVFRIFSTGGGKGP